MKQQTKKQEIEEALEELQRNRARRDENPMTNHIENTQGKTENTITNQDQNTQKITKDIDGLRPTRQPLGITGIPLSCRLVYMYLTNEYYS
jgi:hypothetical protein